MFQRRWRKPKKGSSAVEFALVAPVLFLVFLGYWEWSRVEMVRQTCNAACFEAARRGTLPSATETQMEQVAEDFLDTFLIKNRTVDGTIDVTNGVSTATVTVSLDNNLWGYTKFFAGKSLTASYTLELETDPD